MRYLERLSIKFTEFKRLFIDDHSNDDGWMINMNDFSIEMTPCHDECLIRLYDLVIVGNLMNN